MNERACIFCGGRRSFVYSLNGYDIHRCHSCGVIGVDALPSSEFLLQFYQGFSFQANVTNLALVQTDAIRDYLTSHISSTPATMLDFGGGGGFFAKAFESFGLGEAVYVDVDEQACRFAKDALGLRRVLQGSLKAVIDAHPGIRFDYIHCRHVIEHMPDPGKLISSLCERLSPEGSLVVSCPNGLSKEGVFYPQYWRKFLAAVARDNQWSKLRAVAFSLTGRYGWGLDPPRHLWAITGRSIRSVIDSRRFVCNIKSAALADPVYSPYYRSAGRIGKLRDRFCNMIFGHLLPGMHLVAEIKRRNDHEQ